MCRGLCGTHRRRPCSVCSVEGCTTTSRSGGFCAKHGAKVTCNFPAGCSTNVHARGLCRKHGGHGVCSLEGAWSARQSCVTSACGRVLLSRGCFAPPILLYRVPCFNPMLTCASLVACNVGGTIKGAPRMCTPEDSVASTAARGCARLKVAPAMHGQRGCATGIMPTKSALLAGAPPTL